VIDESQQRGDHFRGHQRQRPQVQNDDVEIVQSLAVAREPFTWRRGRFWEALDEEPCLPGANDACHRHLFTVIGEQFQELVLPAQVPTQVEETKGVRLPNINRNEIQVIVSGIAYLLLR